MLPYGHGCFTVCERERSSSDQALQCPAEGHTLTPAGQELGGCSHEQFSVPVPVCALGQNSWLWPGQERKMRSSICTSCS